MYTLDDVSQNELSTIKIGYELIKCQQFEFYAYKIMYFFQKWSFYSQKIVFSKMLNFRGKQTNYDRKKFLDPKSMDKSLSGTVTSCQHLV